MACFRFYEQVLHGVTYPRTMTIEKRSSSKITGYCVVVLAGHQPGSVLRLISSYFIRIPFSHSFVELL